MAKNMIPSVGAKLPVSKGTGHDLIWIQAEILSIRFGESSNPQFYVHFDLYNKRLDEWVTAERLDVAKMKLPSPKKKSSGGSKLTKARPSEKKRRKTDSPSLIVNLRGTPPSQVSISSAVPIIIEDESSDQLIFSKEKEIEKLRTSGSMTQSQAEISRLKNINRICIGKHIIDTWYFAPYPEEFTKLDILFLCEFCLEPVGTEVELKRHLQKCLVRHPPGNEIYRSGSLSFFELDGRKQRHYCRNLCLISKLFLDHKTLYYEVDPFLYYIMTRNDERGMHILGYFSKEKQSAEDYNVACILTLPQYQRKGYGKLLIAFSYQLSLIERKTGSPEKPLSDLGLLSYRSFWADSIIDFLMSGRRDISVQEISEISAITPGDILHTLQSMDLVKFYKGQFVFYLSEKNVKQYVKNSAKTREKIDETKIEWTPPKFLAAQLNFI